MVDSTQKKHVLAEGDMSARAYIPPSVAVDSSNVSSSPFGASRHQTPPAPNDLFSASKATTMAKQTIHSSSRFGGGNSGHQPLQSDIPNVTHSSRLVSSH